MKLPSTARKLTALTSMALLLGLTACSPAQPRGAELKTDNFEQSVIDWRQKNDDCLLAAGFDIRSPESGEGGLTGSVDISKFDMVAFDAAYAKCGETVGPSPVDETLPTEAEIFEYQLVFASCMRDAGYDYPDPVKGSIGMSPALGPEVDVKVVDRCSEKAGGAELGK